MRRRNNAHVLAHRVFDNVRLNFQPARHDDDANTLTDGRIFNVLPIADDDDGLLRANVFNLRTNDSTLTAPISIINSSSRSGSNDAINCPCNVFARLFKDDNTRRESTSRLVAEKEIW